VKRHGGSTAASSYAAEEEKEQIEAVYLCVGIAGSPSCPHPMCSPRRRWDPERPRRGAAGAGSAPRPEAPPAAAMGAAAARSQLTRTGRLDCANLARTRSRAKWGEADGVHGEEKCGSVRGWRWRRIRTRGPAARAPPMWCAGAARPSGFAARPSLRLQRRPAEQVEAGARVAPGPGEEG